MAALLEEEADAVRCVWSETTVRWGATGVFVREGTAWRPRRWRVASTAEALENLIAEDLWPWPAAGVEAAQWTCSRCRAVGTRDALRARSRNVTCGWVAQKAERFFFMFRTGRAAVNADP
jgi:hypothetical protein